jgi:hypothetical protein
VDDGTPATQGTGQQCGGTSYSADGKTLELYVLFDDSGSWDDPGTVPGAWETVKGAVKGFVSDPASAGIGVALSFFGGVCSSDLFLAPQVGMNVLPTHVGELSAAIDAHGMDGETVTQAALAGGIQFARERLATGVNSRIVMLLVTDGKPDTSDCEGVPNMANDIAAVAKTAASGRTGGVEIPTYVLAVAGGQALTSQLDSIAVAGGTQAAITADAATVAAVFNDIRTKELTSLPCEYSLPGEYDKVRNPGLVNLTFGGAVLGRVADEAGCAAALQGAWHYDNPTAPTRIIACSKTCESFKAAPPGSKVDVSLGCPTVQAQVK